MADNGPASPSPASLSSQAYISRQCPDLTPRSKVRAMLSAMDDSDEEASDKENQPILSADSPSSKLPREGEKLSDQGLAQPYDNAYERVSKQVLAEQVSVQPWSLSKGESNDLDRVTSSPTISQQSASTESPPRSFVGSPIPQRRSPASPALQVSPKRPIPSTCRPITTSPAPKTTDPTSETAYSVPTSKNARFQALLSRRRELNNQDDSDLEESSLPSDDASNKEESGKRHNNAVLVESETDDDREVAKRLTQQARPTRKANKKALEDMNRETQRMSRNMQLAHEAHTKIKFTTDAFLAKFRFKQGHHTTGHLPQASVPSEQPVSALSSSEALTSDVEDASAETIDTPSSSPPSRGKSRVKLNSLHPDDVAATIHGSGDESEVDLVDLKTILSDKPSIDSGSAAAENVMSGSDNLPNQRIKRFSVRRFAKSVKPKTNNNDLSNDDDDDLDILPTTSYSRIEAFNCLPVMKSGESKSLHNLRLLAHVSDNHSYRERLKNSMRPTELHAFLRLRSRQQAKTERDEKIKRLKEKGVIVQTPEEREREQMRFDSMLEKARKEAQDLAKKEKEALKKGGNHLDDDLADSEDEDEEYVDGDDGDHEEDTEPSGSEVEQDEEQDELSESGDESGPEMESANEVRAQSRNNGNDQLFDNEAEERNDEDDESREDTQARPTSRADPLESMPTDRTSRIPRRRVIESDDEDECSSAPPEPIFQQLSPAVELKTPKQATTDVFGFSKMHSPALGLSQLFAGTMAESQTQADWKLNRQEDQDAITFLRDLPPPDLGHFATLKPNGSPMIRVRDSQERTASTPAQALNSQAGDFCMLSQAPLNGTQISEIPEPSQDVGFQVIDSQMPAVDGSCSTVETIPLDTVETPQEQRKKGRLVQKRATAGQESGLNDNGGSSDDEYAKPPLEKNNNAFHIMQKASKQTTNLDDFNKKASEARGMVEEQAEESEDEYAGLGGVSDDESDGEIDDEMKKLIDDEDGARTDERDIAAFYAEKERIEDEKNIEQLYKDVINGGLRRKRGAEHDLWESDDEDEIAARRRAAKQREFAKMRQALLADEKLGKIARNPKQEAFLQAIEDREGRNEVYLLDEPEPDVSQITDSQSGAFVEANKVPNASTAAIGKRKHSEMDRDNELHVQEFQTSPNMRRAGKKTKPTSLADIRNTLSELIGEPDSIVEAGDEVVESSFRSEEVEESSGDEGVDDGCRHELKMPPPVRPETAPNRRRTCADALRTAVIDRMALKRAASSSSNTTNNGGDRLAFQAPSMSGFSSASGPSLLRRASTTGSVGSTGSSESDRSGAGTGYGGLGGKANVKMGGTKKSSVNYYVREQERRAQIELVEKERQLGRERVGKMRRTAVVSGFGALIGGQFE